MAKEKIKKKFKRGLVSEIKERQEKKLQQDRLHQKYHMDEENILIVEKNNSFKFTVKMISSFIRLVAIISILVLAAIGLAAIFYPEPRHELYQVLQDIIHQLGIM